MQEIVASLKSVHLNNERTIWIRPPNDPGQARHLVVFLDGELYRDRVHAGAAIAMLTGVIEDAWFVFVSMQSVEARWIECPCYPPFAHFIAEELLPWLAAKDSRLAEVSQRTLVGLSYTGLAAAFVALACPGLFQKIISQSGSFWSNDGWLAKAYAQLPQRVPSDFHLSVGTKETQRNVRHKEDVLQVMSQIEGVHQFRDVLRQQGYKVYAVEFEGAHEFGAWSRTLPEALAWALPIKAG